MGLFCFIDKYLYIFFWRRIMPSLVGSTIARNFEKAAESSILGTRLLDFYKVEAVHSAAAVDFTKANLAGTGVYTTAASPFAKAVIALQGFVELYYIATPGTAGFVFAVADDTQNGAAVGSNADGTTFGAAEAAIKAAIGADTSVTITAITPAGDGL
jgi:hypothetical protein